MLGSSVPKLLTAKHRRDVSAASLVMHETEILFTQSELDWAADEGSFLLVMIAVSLVAGTWLGSQLAATLQLPPVVLVQTIVAA
jgi:hypothetical protein